MRAPFLVVLVACSGVEAESLVGDLLDGPMPDETWVVDGRLRVPSEVLPAGATAMPDDHLSWRSGLSPAQSSVVRLPDVNLDALPHWSAPTPGEGGVRLLDLDAGEYLPVFAELDAHPDAEEAPALLIRPLAAMTVGHRVAVVVTTEAAARPDPFDRVLRDRGPAALRDRGEAVRELVRDVVALGLDEDEIALAWSFVVGDGAAPLRSALAQLDPPGVHAFERVLDDPARLPPGTLRIGIGTFEVQDLLGEDGMLDVDDDGGVFVSGVRSANLVVYVPASVKDAPAGSVPVLVFGHGIFRDAEGYLVDQDDTNGVLALCAQGGFIAVGTDWTGLSEPDRATGIAVAADFWQLPRMIDRLVQANVAVRTLAADLLDGDLLDDPVFAGAGGQSLPARGRLVYYGISLGGIEGAVAIANGLPVDAGVLHVGGSAWSVMLERSSNWRAFEALIETGVPDPLDRQRVYATSQLLWDPVDPLVYAAGLGRVPVLLQESLGDEQVPNLTTRLLARSAGLVQVEPVVEPVWGLVAAPAPLPAGSRAYVQFDPERPLPDDVNRPALRTDAHDLPRRWPGQRAQVIDFLAAGSEGTVVHHCGAGPCTASSPGDD